MNILYNAHSGLRFLVLLAAAVAIVVLLYGVTTGRPVKAARGLAAAFTGLLDLQVLLGIALVIGGIWYPALMGHVTMMVLAAVVAHGASVMARRRKEPRAAMQLQLAGIVLALVLIVGGIMAIGRSVLGTAAPTLG